MLVLPVAASGQKNFPVVTLLLILSNCFVFFFLQSGENQAYHAAYRYYQDSGLARIEFNLYHRVYDANGETVGEENSQTEVSEEQLAAMVQDNEFQYQLLQRQVLRPGDQGYGEWLKKRETFEAKLAEVFSHKYGYSPARHNTIGLFTYMFLHAGLMHLVGNMVFLWFVGSLLEVGIGWRRYLPGYLVTGVCASLLFGMVYSREFGPLVGASGAIAGLMGAYGLVFARAQIKVFYSLGFYFDYARVPGWLLFPFWVGHEFFQLYTNTGSHVAYMAHVGGLLSGGLLGLLQVKSDGSEALKVLEEKPEDMVAKFVEQGLDHFDRLEIAQARVKICQALQLDPEHRIAWRHLFHIDKCTPDGEHFQQTAHSFLTLLARDLKAGSDLLTHCREFQRLGGKLRLTPDLSKGLALAHINEGELPEASGYLALLVKKVPQYAGLPAALLKLAEAYVHSGQQQDAQKCFTILSQKYGATASGRHAKEQLALLGK